jgi:hypothetical protein
VLLNPLNSNPFSHGFYLSGESASHSESEQHDLTNTWKDSENTEHSDADEDIMLHEFMEDIKRYIRSIDISDL